MGTPPGRERAPERDGEEKAAAPEAPAPAPRTPVQQVLQMQQTLGNQQVARLLARQPKPAPQTPTVPWEEAWTVVHAISDIMNEYHEVKGGMAYPRWHPSHHSEVPAKYRPLLDHWFQVVTRKPIVTAGGAELSLSGEMRTRHLHELSKETDPLIDILMKEGDENTVPWLETEYWKPFSALHRRAFEESIDEEIEGRAGVSNIGTLTEEEALKEATRNLLTDVRLVTTLVTRFTNAQAIDAISKFDDLWAQSAQTATGPVGITSIKGMTLTTGLMHLKNGLDGVAAILAVADPAERERRFRDRPDLFGKTMQGVNVVQTIAQFVSGATALTTAATYTYATVAGKGLLAARVLSGAAPVLDKLNIVLNVIGVVHGVLVLLDDEATDDEKAAAAVEVAISGAGVAGAAARFAGISGVSGPLTLSVAAAYYTFNALAKLAMGASAGILKMWLGAAYETMQRRGKEVHGWAMRFASARDLAEGETADYRREEFQRKADIYQSILKTEVESFLQQLTVPASSYIGAAHRPGSFDSIRKRFQPLVGRKMDTPDQTLEVAAELIKTLVDCFTNADKIFQETFDSAWEEHAASMQPGAPEPPPGEETPAQVA